MLLLMVIHMRNRIPGKNYHDILDSVLHTTFASDE